ncbi:MAG: 16S rRNA (cytosine(1402)-N(4))-methyltransferase RsmH [Magnetococcus sp. MYC-9]
MRQTASGRRSFQTTRGEKHRSVLVDEVMAALQPIPGGLYVDATFGDGGHSQAILQQIGPQGRLFVLDRDPSAFHRNGALFEHHGPQLQAIHTPFSRLAEVLALRGVFAVHGVLFDLGVSSRQLDEAERGFSFQSDGPLDMRMDQSTTVPSDWTDHRFGGAHPGQMTAAHIVNTFTREALADIFFRFGEERHARRIAAAITMDRQQRPFTTTRQLASLLERILPTRQETIHPATRVFQALRIAVNRELEELQQGVASALDLLADGGRVVVISFHSLEDRMVKQAFRQAVDPEQAMAGLLSGPERLRQPPAATPCYRLLTRKPLLPGQEEIQGNPRARSARLRAIERLSGGGIPPVKLLRSSAPSVTTHTL